MGELGTAIGVEVLKARRSRLPPVTVVAFTIAAAVGGMFMYILQDPDRARALGLLGAKAQLADAAADWPGYFALLTQTVAVGGSLIYGLVVVWLFGREFTDRTAKDLLALPTSRGSIVAAKFAVAAGWCLLLAAQAYGLGLLIGAALGLPGWSAVTAAAGFGRLLATATMAVLLVTPIALATSVGRGYLSGVAAMFGVFFTAQIVAVLGYGQWFPWSVPAIYSGAGGPDQPPPGPIGFAMVVVVGVAGVVGALLWWRNADHDR